MNKKILLPIIIFIILCGLLYFNIPLKIVKPETECSGDLKKIGSIDHRDVYTYCIKDFKMIPGMNERMSTKTIEKGTIKTNCYWDGGTCIYSGINYIIVDCQDYQKNPKTSDIIITTKKNEQNVLGACATKYNQSDDEQYEEQE